MSSSATTLTSSAITDSTPAGFRPGRRLSSGRGRDAVAGTDEEAAVGLPDRHLGGRRRTGLGLIRQLTSTMADSMAGPIPSRMGQSEAEGFEGSATDQGESRSPGTDIR